MKTKVIFSFIYLLLITPIFATNISDGPGDDEVQLTISDIINPTSVDAYINVSFNLEYLDDANFDFIDRIDIDMYPNSTGSPIELVYLRKEGSNGNLAPYPDTHTLNANNYSFIRTGYNVYYNDVRGSSHSSDGTGITYNVVQQDDTNGVREHRITFKIPIHRLNVTKNLDNIILRVRGRLRDRISGAERLHDFDTQQKTFIINEEDNSGKDEINFTTEEFTNNGFNRLKLRLEKFSDEKAYDHLACLEIGKRVFDSNGNLVIDYIFAKLNHRSATLGCSDISSPNKTINFSGFAGDTYRFTADSNIYLEENSGERWIKDSNDDIYVYVDDYFKNNEKGNIIKYYIHGSYFAREILDGEKVNIIWNQNQSEDITLSDNYTIPNISLTSATVSSTNNCTITLSWTNPTTYGDSDRNFIGIYRDNEYIGNVKVNDNITTFNDTNVNAGQTYNYQIDNFYQRDKGGDFHGRKSEAKSATIDLLEAPSGLASQQSGCDGNIEVTWNYATNPGSFILQRKTATSNFVTLDSNINGALRAFTDTNVVENEVYYYRIAAVAGADKCGAIGEYSPTLTHSKDQLDITGVFDNNSYGVEASKGYFDNRTELEWSPDLEFEQYVHQYKIFVREFGSTITPRLVETLDINAKTFRDVNGSAGKIYEYFVVAERVVETACGRQITASYAIDALNGIKTPENLPNGVAYDVGLRVASGVINGNIAYEGGTPVENVKVVAERQNTTTGKSLYFNGSNSFVNIAHNETLVPQEEITVSAWIKPENLDKFSVVIEKQVSYGFHVSVDGSMYFYIKDQDNTEHEASSPQGVIKAGQWQNITGTYNQSTRKIKLFVNGEKVAENTVPSSVTSMNAGSHAFPLTLGRQHGSLNYYFQGYIDELKLYTKALTDDEVAKEYGKFSATDADDLKLYLKIFEGAGNKVYDLSHDGDLYFKNDGSLTNVIFSDDIPTQTQLGNAGFTDQFGNYTIFAVEYQGTGENFNIIPTATIGGAVHEFSPSRKTVFVGEGNKVINGQDFEDISSFRFSGYVRFDFEDELGGGLKSSGVEGVRLYLNGLTPISNTDNQIVETNEDGFFDVQIPIGNNFVEFRKHKHVFQNGRFPETGTHDFQEDVVGLEVIDNTVHELKGRVVGGLVEGNKPLFMPENPSVNNIGQAKFTVTSEDGKITRDIVTNTNTGEYEITLPPKKYTVSSVKWVNNDVDIVSSGDIQPIDLSHILSYNGTYETDSVFDVGQNFVRIDSTFYNTRKDFIYRTLPTIIVKDTSGLDASKAGEKFYLVNKGDEAITVSLDNSEGIPSFRTDHDYILEISVVEEYQNLDTGTNYQVPSSDGVLNFNNNIGRGFTIENNKREFFTAGQDIKVNADGKYFYNFKASSPNINENTSSGNEHLSYTKGMTITLKTGDDVTYWPNANNSSELFYAYVIGGRAVGSNFVTKAPAVVDLILRDPGGSDSYAFWEKGTSSTKTQEFYAGGFLDANVHVGLGVGTNTLVGGGIAGVGEIAESHLTVQFELDFGFEVGGGGEYSQTNTFNTRIETNGDPIQIGRSDIFVAKSENLQTGLAMQIRPVETSECGGNCYGPVFQSEDGTKTFQFRRVLQTYVNPVGTPTFFVYSQNHIENVLIPDLEDLRNSLFTRQNSAYTSKLPPNDPNYGTNNDDPVWGSAATGSDFYKTELQDFNGSSYRYIPTGDINRAVDSVRVFNQQIRLWKEALAKNEIEKWQAIKYATPENISISGGNYIEKSKTTSSSSYGYFSFEAYASIGVGLDTSFEGYGVDVDIANMTKIGLRTNGKFGSGFEEETTTGYVIADSDEDDAISQNVYEGVNGNGPIFQTFAGQTSCPFEDKVVMKYVTPQYVQHQINIRQTEKENLQTRQANLRAAATRANNKGGIADLIDGAILNGQANNLQDEIDAIDNELNSIYIPLLAELGGEIILSNKTIQRDKPALLINGNKRAEAFNVPADKAANFNLSLINESESGDAMYYTVKSMDETNPNGLELTIDGQSINTDRQFLVQGNGGIDKVLKVRRGPNHYDYENVGIVIKSTCQADPTGNDAVLSDTIYFNVKYLPICTPLKINSPNNNWTVNNSFNNRLPITVGDYDVNTVGFEEIKIQYKPSTSSDWTLLTTYYRNEEVRTANGGAVEDPLLPTDGNSFTYQWDLGLLPDGDYDIRAVSKCALAETETEIYSGTIDRTNPIPFGLPQPSDGILSPGEEASVQFNETINENLLSPANFDIRGVLNGGKIRHSESISFAGSNNSYVEVEQISFVNQPFTIDFYAKRDANNQKQIVLSQGATEADELEIGFNSSDQIYFKMGGRTLTGTTSINNNWHHYAFTYDPAKTDLSMYYDAGLEAIDNSFEVDVTHTESLLIGKSARIASNAFDGKMHELRLWSRPLTVGNINIYATQKLVGNEAGLLHNWTMEEANGELALDKVRGKHAKMNAEWHISPLGYALELFGTADQANITPVAFTNETDFTIEFWVKTSSINEVLLSNGKGDGTDDNTSGWTIGINGSGNVYAQSNGQITTSTKTVNGGKWTHIAIVHGARANMTLYVDAEEQGNIATADLNGFGGSDLSFGQQTWYVGSTRNTGSYFTGHFDEIRIWNASITQEQLARDRFNMMSGDEPGLVRYYSFDTYTENAGLFSVTSTLTNKTAEAVSNETMSTSGAATLNQDTPTIRLSRPVEKVNFSYVVNNDKIIITLNEDPAKIENVALDFTVKGVKDLNGNSIQSPIKWTAFVDRNQVIWQDNSFVLNTDYQKELVFSTNVVNNSGESKIFEITNIPFWLEVSPTSGTVGPLTTAPITFKVNSDVNVGDYTEDILLSTSDFGFAERLNINVNVKKALPEDWQIEPTDFEFSMNVIGQISIDGSISRDPNNLLGVFVNDECRGIAPLTYVDSYNNYQSFLAIYSNTSFGEELEFRVWEHDKGIVHSSLSHNLSSNQFTADTYQGTAANPKLFSTTNIISGVVDVVEGWRWISFNLNGADLASTNTILNGLNPANGDVIKTRINVSDGSGGFTQQSLFDTYSSAANIWYGSLSNNGGLNTGLLYKVKLSEADKIKYQGSITNPLETPINIVSGWNYLGYLGLANIPINEALANFNAAPGDLIKSQYFSAIYDPSFGWLGTLKVLSPNEGYMMRATNAQSFKFPSFNSTAKTRNSKTAAKVGNVIANSPWVISAKDYESNMTIVAQIDNDELNKNDGVLGAFVNGVCKGYAAPIYGEALDKNIYLLNIGDRDKNATLEFRYLDFTTAIEYKINEISNYKDDTQEGNLKEPKLLTIQKGDLLGDLIIKMYPNPVKDKLTMMVPLVKESNLQIQIFDTSGKQVYVQKPETLNRGWHRFEINTSRIANGIYNVVIVTNNEVTNKKIVISK